MSESVASGDPAAETLLDQESGIGLWLASSVVESLGGTLAISENHTLGSIVRVTVSRLNP